MIGKQKSKKSLLQGKLQLFTAILINLYVYGLHTVSHNCKNNIIIKNREFYYP